MKNKLLNPIVALLLLLPAFAQAQLECRSQLAAHLKPVSENVPLEWAVELVLSPGIMTDRIIYNGMVFGGLNYAAGAHQFYLEGGIKYWRNQLTDPLDLVTDNHRHGLRELFYQWNGASGSITAGLQSLQLDDLFLVNERVWGVNYQRQWGKWDFQSVGATVTKDFARNGTFCSVSYLYDIIPERDRALLGNGFGDTNFGAIVLSLTPGRKIAADELSDDEFGPLEAGTFDEFSEFETAAHDPFLSVDKAGLVIYHEFGAAFPENPLLAGGFMTLNLPGKVTLGTEALYQSMPDNNTIIGSVFFEHQLTWKPGPMNWRLTYWDHVPVSSNATGHISFSNIFAGEVLRLDLIEMPLLQVSLKQRFPRWRFNTTVQYGAKTAGTAMQEIDLGIGKRLGNHAKVTGLFGRVTADALADPVHLARLELRLFY